jgi:lipopolysaccharide transport system ATP-binding protein
MAAVTRLCKTAIFLKNGTLALEGTAESVVNSYLQMSTGEKSVYLQAEAKQPAGNQIASLVSVAVRDQEGTTGPVFGGGSSLEVEIVYEILKPTRGLRVGFHLHSPDGTIIFNSTDTDTEGVAESGRSRQSGVYASTCVIPSGYLNRGKYTLTVGSDTPMAPNFYCENAVAFFIEPDGRSGTHTDSRPGLVFPRFPWGIRKK